MKIRPSLRLYFLIGALFIGSLMVISYSVMSVNNFIDGMDTATRGFLIEAAKKQKLPEGQAISILDVNIASRWQDLPASVQAHFDTAPAEFYTLYKYLDQERWYQRPREAHMVIKVRLENGDIRYASRSFSKPKNVEKRRKGLHFGLFGTTALLGLAMLAGFWFLLLMLIRQIADPMEKLRDWASQLSADNFNNQAPDFRYSELNALADLIRSSLISVQHSLDRERDFLKHASHELRTPIAVVRSSVELLQRLLPEAQTKPQAVIQRIENAGVTMSDLTDTLLWLSREDELPRVVQTIQLDVLLTQLKDELSYLLKGKQVELHTSFEPFTLSGNPAACRIVFANLIRNAFQHTQQGSVEIHQAGGQVVIINHNDEATRDENTELGFGLGLKLTEKLTKRLGWLYCNEPGENGHKVTVRIESD